MMLSLLLLWLFLLLLILLLLSSSSLSSSSSSSSHLTNSCLAWCKSYHFMHLITKVKVSACMAYWHKVLSPKKFIIIIIIIMLIITFMQGISNYIPEKIHVSWVYSVAVVLYLQFVLLFHPWNWFCLLLLLLLQYESN